MKIKLVFEDWQKQFRSIYHRKEGMMLSIGNFHAGTSFNGEIELSQEDAKELKKAIIKGYSPIFRLIIK